MTILDSLNHSIRKVGIKEVARRAGLSASTVSRISSGQIKPSYEVVEKVSAALGFDLHLRKATTASDLPKLIVAKRILSELKEELKKSGIRHVMIFGSVARGDDLADSDIDLYLDFGDQKPSASILLRAEGKIIESFFPLKVDIASHLTSSRGQRLKQKIDKEGVRVF